MTINEKIDKLSWRPTGEAKSIYNEFILQPDYSDADNVEKLLICLVYEGQYSLAISFAQILMEEYKDLNRFTPSLFYAVACDMAGQRQLAVSGYQKILQLDIIPSMMYSQFGIEYCCREFIEYLLKVPFSLENVMQFKFPMYKNTFEHELQKQLPVAKSSHFNIYYYPGSTAEKEITIIAAQREQAYGQIAEFLNYSGNLTIDLYLFEDADKKLEITGHTGAGWAYGTSMIEVYNHDIKVNPYHELVHVIAGIMYGNTVSAFSEGLAVYICKLFGNNPACDVINADYRGLVRQFYQNNELFTLKELLSFQIGTAESKPGISYRQAGALVEFMVGRLGKNEFLGLYQLLEPDYTDSGVKGNVLKIEASFGMRIEELEEAWLSTI